jgi:hypothetical protein
LWGVIVALWNEGLWLEARLRVRLERGSMDGSLRNVRSAGRDLAWVRGVPSMLVVGLLDRGSSSVDMRRNLLMERLLLLLLGRVEAHGRG